MHTHAAFVPPAAVVEQVRAVVAGVPEPAAEPAGRGGLLRRRRAEAPTPGLPQLSLLPASTCLVPLTSFGFLERAGRERVIDAIAEAAAGLAPVRVQVGRGLALVDDTDDSVWVGLSEADGDCPSLRRLSMGIVTTVEQIGLFSDRRRFKPRLALGTVTPHTDLAYLEAVIAALDAMEPITWDVDAITVVVGALDPSKGDRRVIETIPLGHPVEAEPVGSAEPVL